MSHPNNAVCGKSARTRTDSAEGLAGATAVQRGERGPGPRGVCQGGLKKKKAGAVRRRS